jgi:tRNA pseudouridine55 synthase
MARRRSQGRPVNGILLLDKPIGMTSNAALQVVKRLYRARKAGHTGSLDPLASGLLPICLGEATKVSAYLLDADKHYLVRVRLGVTTTTGDADGEELETRDVEPFDAARLESVLVGLRGEIDQVPPMYSALRHKGQRLYQLAREGIEVERAPRRITIHTLDARIIAADELELDVHCSKGTYVRTLAEEIGAGLGCGAHVIALRRTGVGPYSENGLHTLDALRDQAEEQGHEALDEHLLPIVSALAHWPQLRLSADTAFYLRQGQAVMVPKAPTSGWLCLFGDNGTFLGVGQIQDDGRVAPRRLFDTAGGG